jgi:hypothetical protein
MTEAEWFTYTDTLKMLNRARFRSHRRKSRLFTVACCRLTWHLLVDGRSRNAVEVAERHADGAATDEELAGAYRAAVRAHDEMFDMLGKMGSCIEWAAAYSAHSNPFHAAKNASWMVEKPRALEVRRNRPNDFDEISFVPCTVEPRSLPLSLVLGKWEVIRQGAFQRTGADKAVQAPLVRCIFGNPFHPVTFNPSWLTPAVTSVAESIYLEGAFHRLPILADALEDAGCDQQDMLAHCRGPGPHDKGCWVIDLLLHKE